jgi:RNA polymerase sigma-70 factor (ECF subfamily)
MSDSTKNESAFPATRWTAVMKLRSSDEETLVADKALASLCEQYWYPIYAFARRSGKTAHDAQDITQGFFQHILEKNLFAAADPGLGKMRSFLLTAFQRYSNGQRIKDEAQKRGGGQQIISLDVSEGEERYHQEPSHALTPSAMFESAWAHAVIERSMARLKAIEEKAGRGRLHQALSVFLAPDGNDQGQYAIISRELGMTEEALRQSVSRLRKRFRDTLRQEVADTLVAPTPEAVDAELQALKTAITGPAH